MRAKSRPPARAPALDQPSSYCSVTVIDAAVAAITQRRIVCDHIVQRDLL